GRIFAITTTITVWYVPVLFFFSSRRRHTRSDRDWSSDVCSSDLIHRNAQTNEVGHSAVFAADAQPHPRAKAESRQQDGYGGKLRSEERRVGKEGGNGRARVRLKEKER